MSDDMADSNQAVWYHSNRYHAQAACEHCEGIIRHERWCITLDAAVYYAFQVGCGPEQIDVWGHPYIAFAGCDLGSECLSG
jgi:hypothetical protein